MKNKVIDLKSDTVTIPSKEMYAAIANASCSDSFLTQDESTLNLEKKCNEIFGFEESVFLVSGTIANQLAIKAQTTIGDEIVTDYSYHINYYESTAVAQFLSVHMNAVRTDDGLLTAEKLDEFICDRNISYYTAPIKLICIENSINYHSGKIFPYSKLLEVAKFAKKNNIYIHLDGARIINSALEEKIPLSSYSKVANSMMISLTKGLGAPFGAVLMGEKNFISKVRKYNKWCGGGIHKSGLMAECGLYALNNNINDIVLDNDKAKLLGRLLLEIQSYGVRIANVETNIVMLDFSDSGINVHQLIDALLEKGVGLYVWSKYIVRAVTHRDVSIKDIELVSEIIIETVCSIKNNK